MIVPVLKFLCFFVLRNCMHNSRCKPVISLLGTLAHFPQKRTGWVAGMQQITRSALIDYCELVMENSLSECEALIYPLRCHCFQKDRLLQQAMQVHHSSPVVTQNVQWKQLFLFIFCIWLHLKPFCVSQKTLHLFAHDLPPTPLQKKRKKKKKCTCTI